LVLVVVAACVGVMPVTSFRMVAGIVMVVSTAILALGRFLPQPFYLDYPIYDPSNLTLRRLYHQRIFGAIALALAAVMMLMPVGFYAGLWVGRSSWLMPFVFFVVVEVYTAFRIPRVEKG
ncbi:MAG: hypothetical protein K2I99_06845, partial [Bacteroidaceae bacterium]|nr:hypothetical protein [Bacteroidaceae bacterium]